MDDGFGSAGFQFIRPLSPSGTVDYVAPRTHQRRISHLRVSLVAILDPREC